MKASRRQALIGALVVPAATSLPAVARAAGAVTIYDPQVTAHAPAGAKPITGDPIRFAQALFATGPTLVLGISRQADALLIADVGREAGFRKIAAPAALGPYGWALAPKR